MKSSSLDDKTIRPGSLASYSYYHSDITGAPIQAEPPKLRRTKMRIFKTILLLAIVAVLAYKGLPLLKTSATLPKPIASVTTANKSLTPKALAKATPAPAPSPVASTVVNQCAGNNLDELIVVSISERHLWACNQQTVVYDSAVITGMSAHASTITPTGTYHIYAKETNQVLKGCDVTGCWSDPVSYFMPFLDNQYGVYGFHDATWRAPSAFGNILPSSSDGSHGCVELPLATAAWLYNWSVVGTTLTIKA